MIFLPAEITLNIIKYLHDEDLENLTLSCDYFARLTQANRNYLIHLRINNYAKPQLYKKLSFDNKLEQFQNNHFIQKIVLTRLSYIYIEAIFNRHVAQQLVLLKYLQIRQIKIDLQNFLSNRPPKKQLIEQGIFKNPSRISFQIRILRQNLIEDVLKTFVNSYKYNRKPRHCSVKEMIKKLELLPPCDVRKDFQMENRLKVENRRLFYERMMI